FCDHPASTEIYTLSLHDALPISQRACESTRTRRDRKIHERSCQYATARDNVAVSGALAQRLPMADTVFGKIVRGEIPCHKIYEDDKVLAFLDINPLSDGHTLVVSKEPAETLDRLSDESAAA